MTEPRKLAVAPRPHLWVWLTLSCVLALSVLFSAAVYAVEVSQRQEIVFIDAAVTDREALLRALDLGDTSRDIEVIWLDPSSDGVAQISTALARRTNIDALHILSHGEEGGFTIGTTFVDEHEARRHATELEGWQASLRPGADLLIYGCRTARGSNGERFLQTLAELTGADVAGSEHLVGSAQSGGEWVLGVRTGQVETREAVSAAGREAWPGLLAVLGYDGFDYAVGPLTGRNGGTGWSNAWGTGNVDVVATTLNDPSGTLVASNGATQLNIPVSIFIPPSTTPARDLSSTLGADGTTTWFSILVRPDLTGAGQGFAGVNLGTGLFSRLFFGYSDGTLRVENYGPFPTGAPGILAAPAQQGQTVFLVLKVEFLAGSDRATLYYNPTPGLAAPDSADVATKIDFDINGGATFTQLALAGGQGTNVVNNAQLDEIRIGDFYADVAPAAAAPTAISGTVFEDVDFAGTASDWDNGVTDVGLQNVDVELYNAGDDSFVDSVATGAGGVYTFSNVPDGSYKLRVRSATIGDSDTLPAGGLNPSVPGTWPDPLPEMTWGNGAAALGGQDPRVDDTATGDDLGPGDTWVSVSVSGADVTGVHIGFAYDLIVNTEDDLNADDARSVQGSLRQFIKNGNGITGTNTSYFVIPTSDPGYSASPLGFTIQPVGPLPPVAETVVLDGTTQAGHVDAPIIEIDGSLVGAPGLNFGVLAAGSTIRGLVVNRFGAYGLIVLSSNSTIAGNYIGTDLAGTAPAGNTTAGIIILGSGVTVGGTVDSDRNVISATTGEGIWVFGGTGTVIRGNYIGVDKDGGSTGMGNTLNGIRLGYPATIGGAVSEARNVISGNGGDGVLIDGANSSGTTLENNYIGTDLNGTVDLGNGGAGVRIINGSTTNVIGGTGVLQANIIAFNTGDGVAVTGSVSGNAIIRNSIHSNAGIGIDLIDDGVTPNDGAKSGGQPNLLMDFPIFTSATLSGTTLTVAGYVGSAPSQAAFANSTVEVFESDDDPSGNGEGITYLGTLTSSGANGDFSGTIDVAGMGLLVGERISGTATDGSNNTSEFGTISADVTPTDCSLGVVSTATDSVTGVSLRACITWANNNPGADTITVPADTYDLTLNNDLLITEQLTINGANESTTIVDGQALDRVFEIDPGITVSMSDLTIRNGDIGGADGGGIRNRGNLTLTNVTMSGNTATNGGAIFSEGNPNSLTLSNVTLSGNSATGHGGAIGMRDDNASLTFTDVTMSGNTAGSEGGAFRGDRASGTMTRVTVSGNDANDGGGLMFRNSAANVTLTDVTVSNNTATRRGGGVLSDQATTTFSRVTVDANSCTSNRGGGIHFRGGGTANLTNVTVSGNTCDEGGGIHVEGGHTVNLTNVTLNANGAPSGGGGLRRNGGTLTILNTIVANSTSGGDCTGTIVDGGNNLDTDGTCPAGLTAPPLLGPLQDNGGLTSTHELLASSPAIDTGNNLSCAATDQRSVARPIDGNVDTIAVCDIGAYEAAPASPANLALTKTDSVDPVGAGGAFTYNLTATNNGPADANIVTLVDTLPAEVEWQSATPSQGSCVHSGEPLGGTVTCALGTIANGANATVDIGVDAQGTPGVISNSATVSAWEPDPDASDNTATEDTTIGNPAANLNVTQAEDFDPAGVNLPFVYTVTVTNPGPANATLVTLVDTLDAAVTFQTAVPSQGSCAEAGGIVTCDLGDLNNGSIATVDVTVTAPATSQTVTSTAVVSAAEPDSDLSDNTWAEDTDVINPPPADLELTMTDAPDPVVEGTPLTYTLTINNLGPGPASMVQLTDTLPAGVAFVSATLSSSGSCSESLGVVDCSFSGSINNGASETATIVVTAPATAGTITNNASVSTARVDPIMGNDSASVDTIVTVAGEADLSISKSDSPDPVNVNQALSYSLVVDNLGPDDAIDVVLVDTLPATVTFQSVISSQGSCSESSGTVTCNLGMIANAANATVDIIVTAPSSAGSITNNASVSASSDDFDPANDSVSETTTVLNRNINQLCYLVADAGGGGGGNDLLTQIDTADFDPLTNETNIGIGTGTDRIEAIAWNSATGVLYAADSGQLGTLSTTTGVFTALPSSFGTGSGALGNISFNDVDGLTYDATTGILYGSERQSGTDVLIQINMATGAHVPNAFGAGLDYVPMPPILGNNRTDDIAVDPTTGILYAAVNAGGSTDRLIRVNKTTGATTDVALITVPDIEGLGTDPTGQLWGTSGTQRILYELDKATGIGSNGRTINNGSDYEAVDCYAFSPSVVADLSLSKIVDNAVPAEGGIITYTVAASNAGPSAAATVVQVADTLPAGVTFVSAIPSQGTYDNVAGEWFVGTIAAGSTATLNIQASVDIGSAGSTITNTASVAYLSQIDPNAGNDSDSVDIVPVALPANLLVLKSVSTVRDPLGATAPAALAIPGAVVQYEVSVTNSGGGAATETVITDTLNSNLTFLAGEFDGGAADIEIIVGTATPVYCIAEVGGDTNTDGCFLSAGGDDLTVTIPVSVSYPNGLVVGVTAPDNVVVVHFRATVN